MRQGRLPRQTERTSSPTGTTTRRSMALMQSTLFWEYGKVIKVHAGKELLDIDLDNNQQLRATPLYDVCTVH